MSTKRLHLQVTGIVQGVCFRAYTRDEAVRLGVSGWVANCGDGSVEVVAEGDEAKLAALADWCEHGPPSARVFSVDRRWSEARGEFQRFVIARDRY
jgi:acylphosphatase